MRLSYFFIYIFFFGGGVLAVPCDEKMPDMQQRVGGRVEEGGGTGVTGGRWGRC